MPSKVVYILIGPQGSGKTHWAKNVLMKYRKDIVRVSQDDQGRRGHRDLFSKCIEEGKSVVVDRMNFDCAQRSRYTKQVAGKNYRVVFVWFKIARDVCLNRLATREDHPTIAKNADHSSILDFYFDNFAEPIISEYDELLTINDKRYATTLDLVNVCNNKKIIVVGDIHGCFSEFLELLSRCEYRPGDIVVATGDLVDRGPMIRQTLLWFRNTPGAYTLMGNHDNKLMRYWNGNPVTVNNGLQNTIDQCSDFDPEEWCAWLTSLPHLIVLPKIIVLTGEKPLYVVHAGMDGTHSVDRQKIETCLYTRYINGEDAFDKDVGMPWWETLGGEYVVASGHIISDDPHPNNYTFCLDGGAYQGKKLRCLFIDFPMCRVEEVSCSTA